MAMTEMLPLTEPSAAEKCKTGTFTLSSGQSTAIVDVGFQPSKVAIYQINISGSSLDNGSLLAVYDKDMSTSYQFRGYKANGTASCDVVAAPTTTQSNCITEITSNGFKAQTAWAYGTFRYIAVG